MANGAPLATVGYARKNVPLPLATNYKKSVKLSPRGFNSFIVFL
jgi:hypothetical protein